MELQVAYADIPERIAALIHEVFTQAETKPVNTELTLEATAPGYWQWLTLIILILLIVVARIVSTHYL